MIRTITFILFFRSFPAVFFCCVCICYPRPCPFQSLKLPGGLSRAYIIIERGRIYSSQAEHYILSGAKLLSRESLPKSLAKFGPKFVGKCLGAQMMAYIQREGMKEGLGKEKEKKFKNDRYRLIYRNIRIKGEEEMFR